MQFHLKKCGKHVYYQSDISFLTTSALSTHIISYHRNSKQITNQRHIDVLTVKRFVTVDEKYIHIG